MNTKLYQREYRTGGYNGYSVVEADYGAATILSGLTRKMANRIMGIIRNEVNHFCRINRLATLLNDLEIIIPVLRDAWANNKDISVDIRCAVIRVCDWLEAHKQPNPSDTPSWVEVDDPERIAYLSLDNERYDLEAKARKQ